MDINKHIKYILCDIPIYWINLERCKDRREKIESIFQKYDLNNKRIDAIDGNLLDIKEMKKIYKINKKMKNNSVACALSHLQAIQEAYNNNLEKVIIMEDDCNFDYLDKKNKNLDDLIKDKDDWEVIQLGITTGSKVGRIICESKEILMKKFCWGAFAYLINRNGMKKIIDNFNNNKNIEVSEIMIYNFANTYITKPYFTYHYTSEFESSIGEKINKKNKICFVDRCKLFWDKNFF
jgi:GR25 family glycosyltransferase involved in LPS biosynthesis